MLHELEFGSLISMHHGAVTAKNYHQFGTNSVLLPKRAVYTKSPKSMSQQRRVSDLNSVFEVYQPSNYSSMVKKPLILVIELLMLSTNSSSPLSMVPLPPLPLLLLKNQKLLPKNQKLMLKSPKKMAFKFWLLITLDQSLERTTWLNSMPHGAVTAKN